MKYLKKFSLLLLVILVPEFLIMLALQWFGVPEGLWKATLDVGLLFAIIAPLLFMFLKAEDALRASKQELEIRIQERTSQLEDANRQLESWTDDLEQLNGEFSMLIQLGDIFQGCKTLDDAYAVLRRSLTLLFPSDSGAVFIIDNPGKALEPVATWGGFNPGVVPADECASFRLSAANVSSEPGDSLNCPRAGSACICAPVVTQGETLGMLHLRLAGSSDTEGEDFEAKHRITMTVAEHIGLAVQNLKLRESLKEMSIKDPLTGLYNRRHMDASFEREISKAKRKGGPISVVMLDIDHFKKINDTYGHEAGDAVLKSLGSLLIASVRTSDIACRYGGEEFILILPEADISIASKRAEGIRLAVEGMQVQAGDHIVKNMTISAGVSAFPAFGENADAVIAAADAALYKAKDSGRNRVCIAG